MPSSFSCPECGGVLWEMQDKNLLRFRCEVGHAYAANSLLESQKQVQEAALWAAIRSLEEGATMNQRLALAAIERNNSATEFEKQSRILGEHAAVLRNMLVSEN